MCEEKARGAGVSDDRFNRLQPFSHEGEMNFWTH